jgi:FlaA1/EpsC-like NDP-sugar epimerase
MQFREIVYKRRKSLVWASLAALIPVCLLLAFWLRFDGALNAAERDHLAVAILLALPIKLVVARLWRLQLGWGSLMTRDDVVRICTGLGVANAIIALVLRLTVGPPYPRSVHVIDLLIMASLLCAIRFVLERRLNPRRIRPRNQAAPRRVLIYGAGWSGATLASEILGNPSLNYEVAGFIDDDPRKLNDQIAGFRIWGGGSDLASMLERKSGGPGHVDQILIAIPSAGAAAMRAIVTYCREANIPCKTLPGLGDLLENRNLGWQIRSVSVEDLLNRDPVELDTAAIEASIEGRTVLVTGAGGSIGSELCRQVACFRPRLLLMLDRAESDLFRIDLDLQRCAPGVARRLLIADIREAGTIDSIIRENRVECIYHAAAYKHVPLMEDHVAEAVANNLLGTRNLAVSAMRNGVGSFVMISTDKAVNPTSVMGATKRAAELLISWFAASPCHTTLFASVRFGNVLGSNGSVIPIFQSQINAGLPVTVTHPEMRRYFMTIREASQLVLQAAAIARAPGIFVLDMGEPVRIVDLARNMIQLAGLIPDVDIPVVFSGLRPGEKLFEELNLSTEETLPTSHSKIRLYQPAALDLSRMSEWLNRVRNMVRERDNEGLVKILRELIPEYQPNRKRQPTVQLPAAGRSEELTILAG